MPGGASQQTQTQVNAPNLALGLASWRIAWERWQPIYTSHVVSSANWDFVAQDGLLFYRQESTTQVSAQGYVSERN